MIILDYSAPWSLEGLLEGVYYFTSIKPKYICYFVYIHKHKHIKTSIYSSIQIYSLPLLVLLPAVTHLSSLKCRQFVCEPCCISLLPYTFLGCCGTSWRHAAGSAIDDERCPELTHVKLDAHIQT